MIMSLDLACEHFLYTTQRRNLMIGRNTPPPRTSTSQERATGKTRTMPQERSGRVHGAWKATRPVRVAGRGADSHRGISTRYNPDSRRLVSEDRSHQRNTDRYVVS